MPLNYSYGSTRAARATAPGIREGGLRGICGGLLPLRLPFEAAFLATFLAPPWMGQEHASIYYEYLQRSFASILHCARNMLLFPVSRSILYLPYAAAASVAIRRSVLDALC